MKKIIIYCIGIIIVVCCQKNENIIGYTSPLRPVSLFIKNNTDKPLTYQIILSDSVPETSYYDNLKASPRLLYNTPNPILEKNIQPESTKKIVIAEKNNGYIDTLDANFPIDAFIDKYDRFYSDFGLRFTDRIGYDTLRIFDANKRILINDRFANIFTLIFVDKNNQYKRIIEDTLITNEPGADPYTYSHKITLVIDSSYKNGVN